VHFDVSLARTLPLWHDRAPGHHLKIGGDCAPFLKGYLLI